MSIIQRIVVTGTDTEIGKTTFSAGLVGLLGAHYWKPVLAGTEGETDPETVRRLSRSEPARILPEIYKLRMPASPHLAAEQEGICIDPDTLNPPDVSGPLVIEGAGGLMVPLNRRTLFLDVFARWRLPVVLCARTALGTINHTLLSVAALRARDVPILGVAFIGDEMRDTQRTIAEFSQARVLGRLPFLHDLTPDALAEQFAANFSIDDFRQ